MVAELRASDFADADLDAVYGLLQRPSWHHDGACRSAPASVSFFPVRGESYDAALEFCGCCPVRAACLKWALGQGPYLAGIWGGSSQRARQRALGARQKRPPAPAA